MSFVKIKENVGLQRYFSGYDNVILMTWSLKKEKNIF